MIIFYRYSDAFQPGAGVKHKIEEATKPACLKNFMKQFPITEHDYFVIADNVSEDSYKFLTSLIPSENIVRTAYHSGAISFLHAVKIAITLPVPEDTLIYFVEDDYIHAPDAAKILAEGSHVGDYITLYDHPDKKNSQGACEPCNVFYTESTHWKTTISTTMTFATNKMNLHEDWDIYWEHCNTGYPFDHQMFIALGKKGRKVVHPMPGYSTHAELAWLTPYRDWVALL